MQFEMTLSTGSHEVTEKSDTLIEAIEVNMVEFVHFSIYIHQQFREKGMAEFVTDNNTS